MIHGGTKPMERGDQTRRPIGQRQIGCTTSLYVFGVPKPGTSHDRNRLSIHSSMAIPNVASPLVGDEKRTCAAHKGRRYTVNQPPGKGAVRAANGAYPLPYGRGSVKHQYWLGTYTSFRAGGTVSLLCKRIAAVVVAGIALCGCAPATIDLIGNTPPPDAVPQVFDDRDWATVLRENVKDGLVDYTHLQEHDEPLMRYLQLIAHVGPNHTPDLFKDPQDRLAYSINAYNAGVLKAVLHENIPATMYPAGHPSLDHRYRIRVDGRLMTLHELRTVVRQAGDADPRVEFALCGAALGCPPLADQPYRPSTLGQRLEQLACEAMGRSSMVEIDHERQRLLLGRAIAGQREAFLAHYSRLTGTTSPTLLNALLQMADGVRREWLNTAVGYKEGRIRFDRPLNRWVPK